MSSNEKCGWTKFSENRLIDIEKKILSIVKTAYKTWFVPIGSTVGEEDKIWTIVLNEESKNTPLVLLHGFAAGICFWCLNFDHIARDRPVYAIDLLGFGRSSRPNFSNDSVEAEQQMINSLEEWRKQVQLDKFILLGHSFGGYLATSYAINHPDRVKHLILADPWGFTDKPAKLQVPLWFKVLGIVFYPLAHLNPLATVRAAGPMGPWIINKLRGDISAKFEGAIENKEIISEYIYQCNSQKPSGESAFHNMRQSFAWAKNPMIHRFHLLRDDIPITILYGEKSWITRLPESKFKEKRPSSELYIEFIKDAGHHVNADQPHIFNEVVRTICNFTDGNPCDNKISILEEIIETQNMQGNKKLDVNYESPVEDIIVEETSEYIQISNNKILRQ